MIVLACLICVSSGLLFNALWRIATASHLIRAGKPCYIPFSCTVHKYTIYTLFFSPNRTESQPYTD
jgi:hypothetical protein